MHETNKNSNKDKGCLQHDYTQNNQLKMPHMFKTAK